MVRKALKRDEKAFREEDEELEAVHVRSWEKPAWAKRWARGRFTGTKPVGCHPVPPGNGNSKMPVTTNRAIMVGVTC